MNNQVDLKTMITTAIFVLTVLLGTITVNYQEAEAASVRCDLDVSEERITRGQEVELMWETSSARDVRITDSDGQVLIDTDDLLSSEKDDFFDGTLTVKPTRDTVYTLVAERGSDEEECEISVTVRDSVSTGATTRTGDADILVFEERRIDPVPVVAGIHLAQLPYTGFNPQSAWAVLGYVLAALWLGWFAYARTRKKHS